jgi:CMP-N-acetylneuraminic acid synthetase
MITGALIPCRTGSKGILRKNFRDFCGKPLWQWSYDAAFNAGVFDKIIVSSDGGFVGMDEYSPASVKRCIGLSITPIIDNDRPAEHSTDGARIDPLMVYYAEKYPEVELWCLLQPTSPLRTAQDIKTAHKMAVKDRYESVVSVYPEKGFYWVKDAVEFQGKKMPIATYNIDKRPNRQDRKDWYAENGAIYFTKAYSLIATGVRCGGEVGLYVMPQERSYEIDDAIDWNICEFLMGGRK